MPEKKDIRKFLALRPPDQLTARFLLQIPQPCLFKFFKFSHDMSAAPPLLPGHRRPWGCIQIQTLRMDYTRLQQQRGLSHGSSVSTQEEHKTLQYPWKMQRIKIPTGTIYFCIAEIAEVLNHPANISQNIEYMRTGAKISRCELNLKHEASMYLYERCRKCGTGSGYTHARGKLQQPSRVAFFASQSRSSAGSAFLFQTSQAEGLGVNRLGIFILTGFFNR